LCKDTTLVKGRNSNVNVGDHINHTNDARHVVNEESSNDTNNVELNVVLITNKELEYVSHNDTISIMEGTNATPQRANNDAIPSLIRRLGEFKSQDRRHTLTIYINGTYTH
jgi:hypothetical protein